METYKLEQAQQHTTKDDAWIVLFNKVYNITKYLEEHPAGSAILLEVAGTDATEAFEDIGHSDEAREVLKEFQIGVLSSDEHVEVVESYRPTFEKISQVAAITPTKKNQSYIARALGHVGRLSLLGTLGIAAYRTGWTSPSAAFQSISARLHTIPGTERSTFWTAFGASSILYVLLTTGIIVWASEKLDVQQDFTHYAAHRTSRADRIVPLKSGKLARAPVLDPQKWRNFKLAQKVTVSPNVYKFVFALPKADDIIGLPTGQHVALRATINGEGVSRSYTPVSNNTDLGRIELLMKVYPNGRLTNYLNSMAIGDSIEMRGPKGALSYGKSYAKNIGMIAGGTGITPMYQIIRAICSDDSDNTKVSLLYANNGEEDILLREELDEFAKQCPTKFQVHYVLSHADSTWQGYRGFVTKDLIKEHLAPAAPDTKVLLCGPPPMIQAMKSNLSDLGFQTPGLVAKATDQIFLF